MKNCMKGQYVDPQGAVIYLVLIIAMIIIGSLESIVSLGIFIFSISRILDKRILEKSFDILGKIRLNAVHAAIYSGLLLVASFIPAAIVSISLANFIQPAFLTFLVVFSISMAIAVLFSLPLIVLIVIFSRIFKSYKGK